ncbi:MAG: type II toxin-antitoxin system RelE/ParE family toxin [SAR202 cluster bacterium]|nr:type II toxin-antitoxin system RelE/ParE family toxin [SAR202 cluster bacterium]
MPRFRISSRARADLVSIWAFVAADSTDDADWLNMRFYQAFVRLAEFPSMGRARPELGPELRGIPVRSYIIFYRLTGFGVEIVRVLNAARDIDRLF